MKRFATLLLSTALLGGAVAQVNAQSLLGIIGGSGDDALVTIGSGDASNSGLVNVGVGGNNLADVQVGGDSSISSATVGTRGGRSLGADVNLLDGVADVDATVGGRNGAVDANARLLNGTVRANARGGGGNLVDVGVGIGGGGSGGGNGGGGGGAGIPGNAPVFAAGLGNDLPATCAGTNPRQIQQLIQSTEIGGSWQRASNVQVRRVDMCPEVQSWLASTLSNSGLGPSLRSAIANDSLLSASIERSSHSANRVFAVQQRDNQLTVFVY